MALEPFSNRTTGGKVTVRVVQGSPLEEACPKTGAPPRKQKEPHGNQLSSFRRRGGRSRLVDLHDAQVAALVDLTILRLQLPLVVVVVKEARPWRTMRVGFWFWVRDLKNQGFIDAKGTKRTPRRRKCSPLGSLTFQNKTMPTSMSFWSNFPAHTLNPLSTHPIPLPQGSLSSVPPTHLSSVLTWRGKHPSKPITTLPPDTTTAPLGTLGIRRALLSLASKDQSSGSTTTTDRSPSSACARSAQRCSVRRPSTSLLASATRASKCRPAS